MKQQKVKLSQSSVINFFQL